MSAISRSNAASHCASGTALPPLNKANNCSRASSRARKSATRRCASAWAAGSTPGVARPVGATMSRCSVAGAVSALVSRHAVAAVCARSVSASRSAVAAVSIVSATAAPSNMKRCSSAIGRGALVIRAGRRGVLLDTEAGMLPSRAAARTMAAIRPAAGRTRGTARPIPPALAAGALTGPLSANPPTRSEAPGAPAPLVPSLRLRRRLPLPLTVSATATTVRLISFQTVR